MIKTVTFGSVLWDIINGKEFLGGAQCNLASHLARLGCDSYIITRLGNDDRGKRAIERLHSIGVNDKFIQFDNSHSTGTVEAILDEKGVATYNHLDLAAYDFVEFDSVLEKGLSENIFDMFCFGVRSQRSPVNRVTFEKVLQKIKAKYVYLDVNLRKPHYNTEIIRLCIQKSNILKMNEHELEEISGLFYGKVLPEEEFVSQINREFKLILVCITKGENGCTVHYDRKSVSIPVMKVSVVDTIGSGDAFNAGFVYKYCSTGDPVEAAKLGNYLGAYVAAQRGAVPEYFFENGIVKPNKLKS